MLSLAALVVPFQRSFGGFQASSETAVGVCWLATVAIEQCKPAPDRIFGYGDAV